MITLDAVANFAKATLTGTLPAGATSFSVGAGSGVLFPNPAITEDYNIVLWNSTDYVRAEDDPDVELLRVTARSTDTFTIARAQEGTSDVDHTLSGKSYRIALVITAKMITDVQTALNLCGELAGNNTWSGTNTFTGIICGVLSFSGNITYTKTGITAILPDTSDGADNKALTIGGGGAYDTTRGSGIALIGNELATVGGDLELLAGDSAISGSIKMYVGNGAGSPKLVGIIERTTGRFTLGQAPGAGTGILVAGSIISTYNSVITTASATGTVYAESLTYAGNLVSTAYLDTGVASLVTFSTTDDNATKPKANIIVEMTGAGTNMYFGISSSYATGVTAYPLAISSVGKVLFRTTTSATAQANFIVSSDPSSPVDGDWWYNGTNLKFRQGGTTRTISWT